MLWYQKAIVDWIKDEDRNTTFFQMSIVIQRWKNKITAIKGDDNNLIFDKERVKDRVVYYFASLFTNDGEPSNYDIPSGVSPQLSIGE